MEATKFIWTNGRMVPWDEAKVHVVSHTLHYGAGAFEGIRAYKTDRGTAIFRLKEHLERLQYSARSIQMQIPFALPVLTAACRQLINENALAQGYIRPIAIFGYGVMSVSPEKAPVDMLIACWPWGAYLPFDMVDLKISKYPRIPPNATVADAKLTGNYLNGILATNELRGTKYHEVLLLDVKGNLAEGSGENLFLVKNSVLLTPRLGAILPGITRNTIFHLAKDFGLKVEEADLQPQDAFSADEAFFTGTAAEVTPIRSIDDNVVGSGQVGPVTAKLKSAYLDVVYGRNPKYEQFLTRC